ncbi:MAG: hypothetical protein QHJ73_14240, partial [Armatimonadota bacterium]|nr:hypothetical protein [Armatimonadota bacterium]
GTQSIAEVRVESTQDYSNGATLEVYLAPRISSDRQVDNQVVVADRFGFKYYQPGQYELAIGDLSGDFTPYTLNQSFLGLMGWRNLAAGRAGNLRLTTVVGPRWQPGAGFKFDGWVSGVRLAAESLSAFPGVVEDGVLGLSVVRSERGSKARGTRETGLVVAVDAGARLRNGVGLMAEYARSRGSKAGAKPHGEAYLLRATYRVGPLRFIADRERVGAGFTTLSGSAVTNQQRTSLWLRYRPNEWLSANVNFMRTEELDRGRPYRTTMTVPRFGVSVSPFYPMLQHGFLRNLTIDALLRYSNRESDDTPRTIDREYRTLTLALVQRMGDFYLTASRDNDRDLDALPSGVSRRGHGTEVSLRWRPEFPISPIVGIRRSRDSYWGGPRGPISSKVTSRRFGVDIGAPGGIAVELGYELLDNNRTDLGGYDRRVLNLDLTRALDGEGARRVGVTYRLFSNRQQDGTRSYREGQLTGSISQEF